MSLPQNELWLKRAIGFVTRARQEMWGKHNAEIMAFLFECGLSNKTVEKLLLGWNRRSKLRSAEGWGLDLERIKLENGKLFFPEGIVVPYVVEEELKKITIVIHKNESAENVNFVVEGSQHVSMILGEKLLPGVDTYVVENILDGFYLLQECGLNETDEKICLIIPHDLSKSPDDSAREQLEKAGKIIFLTKENEQSCELWAKDFDNSNICNYQSREELQNSCF